MTKARELDLRVTEALMGIFFALCMYALIIK